MKHVPKTVKIAAFKAGLSGYLQSVRHGQEVIISDRDRPIAKVIPYREGAPALQITEPRTPGGLQQLKFKPLLPRGVDPLEFLLADRRKDRNR